MNNKQKTKKAEELVNSFGAMINTIDEEGLLFDTEVMESALSIANQKLSIYSKEFGSTHDVMTKRLELLSKKIRLSIDESKSLGDLA
jgi:hypothetical protein